MPDVTPDDLEQMARILSALETQEVKQRDKATMELEWQGKKSPTKPQREPDGLFARDKQGRLL